MSKEIIIENCGACPFHRQQAERIVKDNNQYWRHHCELSNKIIWDEDRDSEEVISDRLIPDWCRLDNH